MLTRLSINALSVLCDPYWERIWGGEPLSRRMVDWCLERGFLLASTAGDVPSLPGYEVAHAARVAWMTVAERDFPPIVLHIYQSPAVHQWPIRDGNHRLAAAIHRGDMTIAAEMLEPFPADVLDYLRTGQPPKDVLSRLHAKRRLEAQIDNWKQAAPKQ